jgi:iron(III) transport system ATP-binding protein
VSDLRCIGVGKHFGDRTVLSDASLTVPHGTITAILGASGSGKTTLLRIIMGFLRADSGQVRVGDAVQSDPPRVHVPPEARAIGYVAQEGALFPHLNVGRNVSFGLPFRERKTRTRIDHVLELVGLSGDYAERRPYELSGGEQRRVALARALAPRPRIVLLDEPFAGLDAALRADTRSAVVRALAEEGTTGLLVTHDQGEAMSMGREVGVLRGGRLVQTAAPNDLYRRPVDLDVARFVGDAVVLPARANGGSVECAFGTLRTDNLSLDGNVQALIRPEQISLVTYGDARTTDPEAEVLERTFYGAHVTLSIRLRNAGDLVVMARAFSHAAPEIGETVRLRVQGTVTTYPPEATTIGSRDDESGPR